MAHVGASSTDTVMIGDTTFDMEMAANAGVRALGVAWGYHGVDALRAAGADMIVDRFTDIPIVVADMMSSNRPP